MEFSYNSKHGCLECSGNSKQVKKRILGVLQLQKKFLLSLYFGVTGALWALTFIEPGACSIFYYDSLEQSFNSNMGAQSSLLTQNMCAWTALGSQK